MKINNRRYIGCKTKLVDFIYQSVVQNGYTSDCSFADIFAGTGVVGDYFASKGYRVLLNDMLYSNFIIYQAFHGEGNIDDNKIYQIIANYNLLNGSDLESNYFSSIYGNKYYALNDAKKIGFIRDDIERIKESLTSREYYVLIASLLYAADKIANTVGHFESFLKKEPIERGVLLPFLEISFDQKQVEIFNLDANELARLIKYDVVYIDPPYNARQYVNFYHVLENLARWKKPTEFDGNSMKFKRDGLKSDYCRNNKAPQVFEDLINSLQCKLIVVSYNNTYDAKSSSSNNTISEDQLLNILKKKGKVRKKEIDYNPFNTGKTNFENHKEYLYICEVR